MNVLGFIFIMLGIIGLFIRSATIKDLKKKNVNNENDKAGAKMWLVVYLILIIVGIMLI